MTEYYFSRRLRMVDAQGNARQVGEAALLEIPGPKILLGEPGMGKSRLIIELGNRLNIEPISAVRLLHHRNPKLLVHPGQPLLVDGLDEAMARSEGDAVDIILAQLEYAGSPPFIISCRARDWQARTVTNLRQVYGVEPAIFTLEALSPLEAYKFLKHRYPGIAPEIVLDHLDEHGIAELYGNPLTLGLMGQVAERDAQLPATRAALFERVCTLLWSEHDSDRQDTGLGKITQDQALSAAGAIMAGLLLSGSEAVSLAGPNQLQESDIRLADLEALPDASATALVFSSKLFDTISIDRAKPTHRVIAEFLGARWLAQQAKTARSQRRLLSQMQGSGAVPASWRGLHAWLAFHSPSMAIRVIATDPFGVLRYGETASLTSEQAGCMFDALQHLAELDPYFRGQDWNSHSTIGLMKHSLHAKIETTIASSDSNSHFRSLLIEGLKGTPLAATVSNTLEKVMFSAERFFAERQAAAEALMPHRDHPWWQEAIATLLEQVVEDSTRLALKMIEAIDCNVSNALLVATLLAEIGVATCALPQINSKRIYTLKSYHRITEMVPRARLIEVLNLLSEHAFLVENRNWESASDFAQLVSLLILRAIEEGVAIPENAALVWNWLGAMGCEAPYDDTKKRLQAHLEADELLRHAIQLHALYTARPRPTIWMSEIDLVRRLVGLGGHHKDIAWFLSRLTGSDNKNPVLRKDWCDLMRLGNSLEGIDPDLRSSSRAFQAGDQQLEGFVRQLEKAKPPAWKRKQERAKAKQERKRRIEYATDRRFYIKNRAQLRAGELATIIEPAKAYLGLFRDLKSEPPPKSWLIDWLGVRLTDDAMTGFEAVLHRSDIPSMKQVAQGFATNTRWNYCFAIIAGLLARQHAGLDFADLSVDTRTTGLLLLYNDRIGISDNHRSALRDALEVVTIPTAVARENFARTWIEPLLDASKSHISGLHTLAHDERWRATAAVLAPKWLLKYSNLPIQLELQLVDCAINSGALASLAEVAAARDSTIFHNEEHLFTWLAIDLLVRFDLALPNLVSIGKRNPEFIWYVRDRFQIELGGVTDTISIAQAKWVVEQFRAQWPYATMNGGSGDKNPYDATIFLNRMINHIAANTRQEAIEAMQELVAEPSDSYSNIIRHMAAEQRQKCAEERFLPVPPRDLGELVTDGIPTNVDDLKSIVLEELAVAKNILCGDDLDQVRDFWHDAGIPYDENRCRDRLAAMIGPELMRYGILRITEADMPNNKRADLAFAFSQLQLPMEVKGQWHPKVWDAATDQLDLQYLVDWRSDQRGIYCVLWFGEMPSSSGRRLKPPPNGMQTPKSADEMRNMLINRIPEARRALIDVVVIDLTSGKS